MNKEEMIGAFALKTGFTKRDSENAVETMLQLISDALVSGEKVQLVGFGTFEVKDRAPRVGRNPKANVPVEIPARRMPYFKPGKVLKAAVGG